MDRERKSMWGDRDRDIQTLHPGYPRPGVFNFSLSMSLLLQDRQMPRASTCTAKSHRSKAVKPVRRGTVLPPPQPHACCKNTSLLHTVSNPTPLPHNVCPLSQVWGLLFSPLESPSFKPSQHLKTNSTGRSNKMLFAL